MNWMKYRLLYFAISLLVIVPGTYSLIRYGLKLSIEFTGGSVISFTNVKSSDKILEKFNAYTPVITGQKEHNLTIKAKDLSQEDLSKVVDEIKKDNPDIKISSFESLGPTIGKETIKKTLFAVLISSLLLLFHITRAFKQLKYGVSAIIAMLHDTLVLLGSFSLLGHFFNVETDLLFVTAILTVLSFSVHDTIVVYDRIRELRKKNHLEDIRTLANKALSETMVRSIINSLTIVFMLTALVLLGGDTTKNFAIALLIGSISGAYSSPFNAVPILVTWEEFRNSSS